MSDSGSLREAIAAGLHPEHIECYDVRTSHHILIDLSGEVLDAVAQWFRDHETERVEAGAEGSYHSEADIMFASRLDVARYVIRASDAVVFPAREEESDGS